MSQPPPNNALKLPFAILGLAASTFATGYGAAEGRWFFILAGSVLIVLGCAQVRAIRKGRNPWWSRAPIDYQRDPNKRTRWKHQ